MESYTIKHLNFSYPKKERRNLKDITTTIHQGEFIVICGSSGSGKTTLLRQLKPILAPHGEKSGTISFEGKPLEEMTQREQAQEIGYVLQIPENQIVTDKVWHELAFGLESLGLDTPSIRLRVAEMASFFGIQNWFHKSIHELSGGQKQILNLASVMVMQPSVLILDEPTSQLDPIAATNFLETLEKINRELGTTIILTEHRLDEVFPMADRVLVLEDGQLIADDTPRNVGDYLSQNQHNMFYSMPIPMQIYNAVDNHLKIPLTIREGRKWLEDYSKQQPFAQITEEIGTTRSKEEEPTVHLEDVWFKYEKDLPDVVKGVSLKAYPGEMYAILGGNGVGKTTLLSMVSGLNQPYRGSIQVNGKNISEEKPYQRVSVLPQNPQTLFIKKSVEENLNYIVKEHGKTENSIRRLKHVISLCQLENLLKQHPYDLSGGEQQRLALAMVLLRDPEILLLDEPTKGMDADFKRTFAVILKRLLRENVTILMISHDVEFCANYADFCALFFDGTIVSKGETRDFFSGNNFYTTAANRMSRHLLPEAITAEDVIQACGGKIDDEDGDLLWEEAITVEIDSELVIQASEAKPEIKGKNIIGFVSILTLLYSIWKGSPFVTEMMGHPTLQAWDLSSVSNHQLFQYVRTILLFSLSIIGLFYTIFQSRKNIPEHLLQVSQENRKLSKRTKTTSFIILCLIPLTIYFGIYYLGDRKYYFISMLIILQIMIPFTMVFEGRKPQAREIVVIAVLCALGVAGRAAFFMLPQFKPVAAIIILSGIALGGESGFFVGAMTMFLSNLFYSQGPWTPWQMFAMGIIGFLAGVLYQKGLLRRNRLSISIFGGLVVFFIYGGIMNPASVMMYQANINWGMLKMAFITGLPFDMIHAIGTFFFLFLIAEPMLEKLDRIKIKYGLISD